MIFTLKSAFKSTGPVVVERYLTTLPRNFAALLEHLYRNMAEISLQLLILYTRTSEEKFNLLLGGYWTSDTQALTSLTTVSRAGQRW